MVIESLPKYRERYAAKFISFDERIKRKNRGPMIVYPSDFVHWCYD